MKNVIGPRDAALNSCARGGNNSGNYIAMVTAFCGPALAKSEELDVADFAFTAGAMWGVQRNYGKRFMMTLGIGPGFGVASGEIDFVLFTRANFGFRIGR